MSASSFVSCLPVSCPLSSLFSSLACSSVSGVAWSFSGAGRVARVAAARRAASRAFGVPLLLASSGGVFVLYIPGSWPGASSPSWASAPRVSGWRSFLSPPSRVSFVPLAGLFGR